MDVSELLPEVTGFVPFTGSGSRLDGKKKYTTSESEVARPKGEYVRGIPDYDYEIGTIKFIRYQKIVRFTIYIRPSVLS
jgi:ubiquitin fusion degradation protein 1